MKDISYHMKLIDDNMWNINVYISRVIEDEKGNKIDGDELWDEYIELLKNNNLPYSEKQIKLFNLKAKLYLFIYQIKKNSNIVFDDKIGELYKINNGDKFFENGKLDKSKLESIGALWIDI